MAEKSTSSKSRRRSSIPSVSTHVAALDYETQYFGFHPRTFTDGVYEIWYNYMCSSMEAVQNCLTEKFSHVLSEEEVKSRVNVVTQEMLARVDEPIDELETTLNREVFSIPKHVILPEDHIHLTNPITKEDMEQLDNDTAQLRKDIKKAQIRKAILIQRIKEQEQASHRLQQVRSMIENSDMGAEHTITKCQKNFTSFIAFAEKCCEKLDSCEKLLQEKIPEPDDGSDD